MDAPGTTTANRDSGKSILEHDTLARSRSPSDTNPDRHDRRHQDSDDGSEGSDGATEEGDSDDEDEEDDEPRLKYAYLTKHLGSVYRNGDATSTFLVAGDKMVRMFSNMVKTTWLTRMLRLLERIMVSS